MSEEKAIDAECFGCAFFRENPSDNDGHCHRYPPSIDIETDASIFPPVQGDDWCGEFKPKEEK